MIPGVRCIRGVAAAARRGVELRACAAVFRAAAGGVGGNRSVVAVDPVRSSVTWGNAGVDTGAAAATRGAAGREGGTLILTAVVPRGCEPRACAAMLRAAASGVGGNGSVAVEPAKSAVTSGAGVQTGTGAGTAAGGRLPPPLHRQASLDVVGHEAAAAAAGREGRRWRRGLGSSVAREGGTSSAVGWAGGLGRQGFASAAEGGAAGAGTGPRAGAGAGAGGRDQVDEANEEFSSIFGGASNFDHGGAPASAAAATAADAAPSAAAAAAAAVDEANEEFSFIFGGASDFDPGGAGAGNGAARGLHSFTLVLNLNTFGTHSWVKLDYEGHTDGSS